MSNKHGEFVRQSEHFLRLCPYVAAGMIILALISILLGKWITAGLSLIAAIGWGVLLPPFLRRRVQKQ